MRETTAEPGATRPGRVPALELVGPSGTAGTATIVSDDEARIELAGEADPIVGTELVRQLVVE